MSEEFLAFFPISNPIWKDLISKYLMEHKSLCTEILRLVEPLQDKLLPKREWVFRAISGISPSEVKVIILGQDPYPNREHACGLAFSSGGDHLPASLRNIFVEIQKDYGGSLRTNPNLTDWVQQGVLLLNTSLTVEEHKANSHSKIGWQTITKFIIKIIWTENPNSIFLLWGKTAQKLLKLYPDSNRVLMAGHPSPLSYGKNSVNNFKGCGHFKKANDFLISKGLTPILW